MPLTRYPTAEVVIWVELHLTLATIANVILSLFDIL